MPELTLISASPIQIGSCREGARVGIGRVSGVDQPGIGVGQRRRVVEPVPGRFPGGHVSSGKYCSGHRICQPQSRIIGAVELFLILFGELKENKKLWQMFHLVSSEVGITFFKPGTVAGACKPNQMGGYSVGCADSGVTARWLLLVK